MGLHLRSQYYGCPACGRIELSRIAPTACAGPPGAWHEPVYAEPVPAVAATDSRQLFVWWDGLGLQEEAQ